MINFGTQSFTAIELGTQLVSAVYWGTQSVYPATQEVFIYLGHENQNSGSAGNTITKINQSRVIQWQRVSPWLSGFGSSTTNLFALNNRIYTAQYAGNPSNGGTSSSYDANGVSLNVYSHSPAPANNPTQSRQLIDVAADTSGNIYVCGARDNTTGFQASLRKLSSTGSQIWRYDHLTRVNSVSVDGSNNVYFGGLVNTSSISIRKLNSSGVSQWSANHGATVNRVLADTSGNLYVAGLTGTGGFTVRKYNTTGSLQWSRGLNTHGQIRALAFDSIGNIWCGGATASGNPTWSVVEYDTSGNALGYYNMSGVFDMDIDDNDDVYVANGGRGAGKYSSSGILSWTYSVPNNRSINGIVTATY